MTALSPGCRYFSKSPYQNKTMNKDCQTVAYSQCISFAVAFLLALSFFSLKKKKQPNFFNLECVWWYRCCYRYFFFRLPFSGTEVLQLTITYLLHLKALFIPKDQYVCKYRNKKSIKPCISDSDLEVRITILSRSISDCTEKKNPTIIKNKQTNNFLACRCFCHSNWFLRSMDSKCKKRNNQDPKIWYFLFVWFGILVNFCFLLLVNLIKFSR